MTQEQAKEIRVHFEQQLLINGFADVFNEVLARFEENYNESQFENNQKTILHFFVREAIDVFDKISNNNYERLLASLNEYLEDGKVEDIVVESIANVQETYSLRDLPSYSEIVIELKDVLNEIESEF
jgi:hypothetical protein